MDSFQKQQRWWTASSLSFWGTLIQTVFSLIGIVVIYIFSLNIWDIALDGVLSSFTEPNFDQYQTRFMTYSMSILIAFLIAFLGYVVYLIGICLFKGAQQSEEADTRTLRIMLVELIMPVLYISAYAMMISNNDMARHWQTPIVISVFLWIVSLVATIYLIAQYNALAHEPTWDNTARRGAANLKASYQYLIWIQVVIIAGCMLMAWTVYSTYSEVASMRYSTDSMNDMFDGVNRLQKMAMDFANSLKIESIFTGIAVVILSLMWAVSRISGWHKIKSGKSSEEYAYAPQAEPDYTAGGNRFCHKCGTPLPDDASFCPSCGTPVAVVTTVNPSPYEDTYVSTEEVPDEPVYVEPSYEDEEPDNRKKWMLWGGIAAGVIALGAGLWAIIGGGNKFEPNAKVFTDSSIVYSSIDKGAEGSEIKELNYGTYIESIDDDRNDDRWTKIRFDNDGELTEGYIDKNDLLSSEEFNTLDAAGFDKAYVREQIRHRMQRLAVLDALNNITGNWELENLEDNENAVNAKYVTIRKASPSEQCFAFSLIKNGSDDERKAFVYSTPGISEKDNAGHPVFLYTEDVPIDKCTIRDVTYNKKKDSYNISYLIRMGYCGEEEDDEDYPTDDSYTPSSVMQYLGAINLKGKIDGKYEVDMTLYERDNGTLGGHYKYVKTGAPIDLSGIYTNSGNIQYFSIDEYVDGNITGSFSGQFDGVTFSGTWTKADGSRTMPFSVRRY